MRRSLTAALFIAKLLLAGVAYGQEPTIEPVPVGEHSVSDDSPVAPHIEGKAHYELGEKIKLVFKGSLPDGASPQFSWTLPEGFESELVDGNSTELLWTRNPGSYKAPLHVTYSIDILVPGPTFPSNPADIKQTKLSIALPIIVHEFTVGPETPRPPPEPDPDPDPDPTPPPVSPWSDLVPSAAHRALVSEFYADFAAEVRSGVFTATSHFRNGYRESWKRAQDAGSLPTGLTAIDQPISDRIAAAIGLADVPMDATKQAALAALLDTLAAEFKG